MERLARVPDLDSLQLLLDVADTGSLGKAGRLRGISQPAATSRVRNMEVLLGIPLVERSPRGSTLTSSGKLVAEWAQTVLAAAEAFNGAVSSLRGDREGRLRIAASLTVAEHLLPGWLAKHARQYPETTVRLTAMNSVNVAAAVLADEVDLGFVEGPSVARGLSSQVIRHDRLVLVVSPRHPLARKRQPVEGRDLANLRLVSREPQSGSRQSLDAALRKWGPVATPLLELSTASSVRAAATAGAGPAVLSDLAIADDLQSGRLVEVPVSGVQLTRALRAVWPAGRLPHGPARELLDIARRGSPRP